MSYAGRTAVITGGASGIGYGIAEFLVAEGCSVVIADVNKSLGEQSAKQLSSSGKAKAFFCYVDVTQWKSVVELFAKSKSQLGGRIDYIFANAGIAQNPAKPIFHLSDVDTETLADNPPDLKVIEVNAIGACYTVYAALAYIRKQDKDNDGWRGKIVVTGSSASFYAMPADSLYGMSKHGVLGLVRSIGSRVFDEGITINAFGPSLVESSLAPPGLNEKVKAEGRMTPMSTIQKCIDMFIKPSCKLTGQIAENCMDQNVLRSIPPWLNDTARTNWAEFWDVDRQDAALKLDGDYLVI